MQSYSYDADNRLIKAQAYSNTKAGYQLNMQYSPAGRILLKELQGRSIKNGNEIPHSNKNKYLYKSKRNPYAVTEIVDMQLGWGVKELEFDAAGNNCAYITADYKAGLYWTEDNRMQAYAKAYEDRLAAYYRYDHTGKRDLKVLGKMIDVYNMGRYYAVPVYDDMVLYAGDLMTIDCRGVKKHYFVEGERFLTNCGMNNKPIIDPNTQLEGIAVAHADEMSEIFSKRLESYFADHSTCYVATESWSDIHPLEKVWDRINHYLKDPMPAMPYYHHNDRLGSGVAITDGKGYPVHMLAYMPYGETLLDLSKGFETPYQFTGYEKDQETGLNYAQARYYDSDLSMFTSTDPMWHKYPHLTPYNYCANNPVMLVDPDGETPIAAALEGVGAFAVSAGVNFLSNWIFEGQDCKTAFKNVKWGAATLDGLSTAALSFFVDGTGTAKTMAKIGKSKAGRFAIDVVQTMMINVTAEIESGKKFSEIDLQDEFLTATFTSLLSNGMSKKADELLESLKSSNKSLYSKLNKLQRNIDAGKNEVRIKRDTHQADLAKQSVNRSARAYAKETTKNRAVSSGTTETIKQTYNKINSNEIDN